MEGPGLGRAKDLAEKNNYKTKAVPMIPKPEIPLDCTILVVGGPKRNYLQPAVDAVKDVRDLTTLLIPPQA